MLHRYGQKFVGGIACLGYHPLISQFLARGDECDDDGLAGLLDLHGSILEMGMGYWVKIVARRVPADQGRPRGINYSLTLHGLNGNRIMGYDNAHSVRHNGAPAKACSVKYDHRHRREKIAPYDYTDAGSLLNDFWNDVNLILKEEGVP